MSGVMFSFGRVLPGLLADGGRDDEVIGSTTDTSQPSASSSPYKAEVKCSASPCVCLRLSAPLIVWLAFSFSCNRVTGAN